MKRFLTLYGDTMENQQPPQNGQSTAPVGEQKISRVFEKQLFPTQIRSYEYGLTNELIDSFLELINDQPSEDLMSIDHPSIEKFKEIIYDICQDLEEFKANTDETRTNPSQIDENLNYLPEIIGSNVLFQQTKEHIPLHAYEFVPLVFTFVMNTGSYPQFTYYADTRGGVQTIRQKIGQGLVGTYFGLRGQVGEVIITPGYLQRYTETNLSDQAQVFFNVMVGFASY